MFQLIFIFRILKRRKATSSHRSILLYELCTKEFRVLDVSIRVRTEIKAKTSFLWGRYFKYANWMHRYSYTNLCLRFRYESQFHMCSVNLIVYRTEIKSKLSF